MLWDAPPSNEKKKNLFRHTHTYTQKKMMKKAHSYLHNIPKKWKIIVKLRLGHDASLK
jgi:hypothetical protein